MKNKLVLILLFVLPIAIYLIFSTATHNSLFLPTISKANADIPANWVGLNQEKISMKDKITVLGFVGNNDMTNEIFMGRRDRSTYINSIQGKFTINSDMNFNLSLRHYLSYATYNQYYSLQNDGTLMPTSNFTQNSNSNFNAWNLDLSYSWWFAPGSQISILYRNNAALFENEFKRDLGTNIRNVIDKNALDHVFSVSVRYFIDYNSFKK
jgi:hypothetical protein